MSFCYYYFETDIGRIGLLTHKEQDGDEFVAGISFGDKSFFSGAKKCDCVLKKTPLMEQAFSQLNEYFSGKRKEFDIPTRFVYGTAFMKEVWQQLLKIPYGQTMTYSQMAVVLGRPKAPRAVGNALNKNPLAIIVPCHRVIGSNGKLTGFAGGLKVKQQLLDIEKTNS